VGRGDELNERTLSRPQPFLADRGRRNGGGRSFIGELDR